MRIFRVVPSPHSLPPGCARVNHYFSFPGLTPLIDPVNPVKEWNVGGQELGRIHMQDEHSWPSIRQFALERDHGVAVGTQLVDNHVRAIGQSGGQNPLHSCIGTAQRIAMQPGLNLGCHFRQKIACGLFSLNIRER